MVRVFVFTCDKYSWALKGFAHLFNKYWSALQPVIVCGYTPPDGLPDNFGFYQIDKNEYPSQRWTTGLIKTLNAIDDSHIVIMLEDYWLCRGVNHQAINTLHELATHYPQILRIDLTDDRQYNGNMRDFDTYLPYYGYNDIVWTPPDSPYQSSLQAGIWNRKRLLEVVQANESAWQFEIGQTATNIRGREDLWVLGTRQRPIRYANVFRGGDSSPEALNLAFLVPEDVEELKGIGALTK